MGRAKGRSGNLVGPRVVDRRCATARRPSIDTTRLAAQVQRRQAVYVRSRAGRLKVIRYVPWERSPPAPNLTQRRKGAKG